MSMTSVLIVAPNLADRIRSPINTPTLSRAIARKCHLRPWGIFIGSFSVHRRWVTGMEWRLRCSFPARGCWCWRYSWGLLCGHRILPSGNQKRPRRALAFRHASPSGETQPILQHGKAYEQRSPVAGTNNYLRMPVFAQNVNALLLDFSHN